jgi:hypothetical protein
VTETRRPSLGDGFDVVGVSVGAGLLSGGLSLVAPGLVALTGSLAVLAIVGWLTLARQALGTVRRMVGGGTPWALASVGTGAGLFFVGGPLLASVRGLVLAVSLVPLWTVCRRLSGASP